MHFLLLIVTDKKPTSYEIEELMEPYCEHNEVDPYISRTKEDILKGRGSYINQLKNSLKVARNNQNDDWEESLELRIKELSNQSDEEYYLSYIEGEEVDEDGNILSTYNPNGKWDWYDTDNAGRWNKYISAKFNAIDNSISLKDIISVVRKDIDLDPAKKENVENGYQEYLLNIQNNPTYIDFSTGEEKNVVPMDFKTFVYQTLGFYTYAVLDENGWHEQSLYDSENNEYFSTYFDKFILNNEDKYGTFIDYHC